ncbi:hypothetical protein D9619_010321 [Psilocybe cf. subviscida]|uniref:Profilin n=1 Tax=Psilocybe cf. subviscida TaxID=2480587 RepID=A0A8H5AS26_9AGAR|nr:hypothetical protein D9619_010321 [Psilocybe cf. subviscida]
MSWQAYVDTNLVGSGKVTRAAILGQKGGVWASSPGFTISPEEEKAIIKGYTDNDSIRANGVRLGGQKFFTLSVEGRTIQAKKGADGVVIVQTKQAILVAVYESPLQAPETTPIVEALADYMISVNF